MDEKIILEIEDMIRTIVRVPVPQQIELSSSCPPELHLLPRAGRYTELKKAGWGKACDSCDFLVLFQDQPHQRCL